MITSIPTRTPSATTNPNTTKISINIFIHNTTTPRSTTPPCKIKNQKHLWWNQTQENSFWDGSIWLVSLLLGKNKFQQNHKAMQIPCEQTKQLLYLRYIIITTSQNLSSHPHHIPSIHSIPASISIRLGLPHFCLDSWWSPSLISSPSASSPLVDQAALAYPCSRRALSFS